MSLNCRIKDQENEITVVDDPPKELINYVTTIVMGVYLTTVIAVGTFLTTAMVYRLYIQSRVPQPSILLEILMCFLLILLPVTTFSIITNCAFMLAKHLIVELTLRLKSK